MSRDRNQYHCDGCDPEKIVAPYIRTHLRDGKRLCCECADEHDRRSFGTSFGRCHTCSRVDYLTRTIGDLCQCSDCVTTERRERDEARQ